MLGVDAPGDDTGCLPLGWLVMLSSKRHTCAYSKRERLNPPALFTQHPLSLLTSPPRDPMGEEHSWKAIDFVMHRCDGVSNWKHWN